MGTSKEQNTVTLVASSASCTYNTNPSCRGKEKESIISQEIKLETSTIEFCSHHMNLVTEIQCYRCYNIEGIVGAIATLIKIFNGRYKGGSQH